MPPIIVVGNGPVGLQVARLLLEKNAEAVVLLYGDEEVKPYNRVQLSAVLAGSSSWQSIQTDPEQDYGDRLIKRYGFRIQNINTEQKTVTVADGSTIRFSSLVLATGSRPYIPGINGIHKNGVFTLRNQSDVNALIARQVRSHHCVILGGGLLGLEAARAMQRWKTRVTVIEHAPCLLPRQLDLKAAAMLQQHLEEIGINVYLNQAIKAVQGDNRVQSLLMHNGEIIECDTLVVSTGIVPNVELAREAGLSVGRGIRVNDRMQTSDPGIYAVGECAEHREKVFGLVAPGLEQAGVAVHNQMGGKSAYQGSITASRLKVLDQQVLSSGEVGYFDEGGRGRSLVFENHDQQIYRRLLIWKNRLIGVLAYGEWDEAARVQSAVSEQKLIMPWQQLRFRKTGYLWPQEEQSADVAHWPAVATICQCTGVNRGRISAVIAAGALTSEAVCQQTGASSVCGSCRSLIDQLVGLPAKPQVIDHSRFMTIASVLAFLLALMFLLPVNLPYNDSVQVSFQWDLLWRDEFYKQVTGFTMLGLFSLGLLVSLRKRIKSLQSLGSFKYWRSIHLLLGLMTLGALVMHTGFRLGSGLNLWLMSSFVGLMLLGALNSGILGQQHRLDAAVATTNRRRSLNWHIFLFWPVPVLLAFHVLKSYWF